MDHQQEEQCTVNFKESEVEKEQEKIEGNTRELICKIRPNKKRNLKN
jgi:hypothetical protein